MSFFAKYFMLAFRTAQHFRISELKYLSTAIYSSSCEKMVSAIRNVPNSMQVEQEKLELEISGYKKTLLMLETLIRLVYLDLVCWQNASSAREQ